MSHFSFLKRLNLECLLLVLLTILTLLYSLLVMAAKAENNQFSLQTQKWVKESNL